VKEELTLTETEK
jgi:hypothetical protein